MDTILVTVNAANITHVANAGFGSTIKLPVNTTSLSGSGNDADGTIAGYAWSLASGPPTFFWKPRFKDNNFEQSGTGNLYLQITGFFPIFTFKKY